MTKSILKSTIMLPSSTCAIHPVLLSRLSVFPWAKESQLALGFYLYRYKYLRSPFPIHGKQCNLNSNIRKREGEKCE